MTDIWNLGTLCRCCHSDGCFKSLNLRFRTTNGFETYETMLQTLGITILQPQPPVIASYTICDVCIAKLRDATKFREQVIACEQKFQIYCTNEQFLSGATDNVKVEKESIPTECDDEDMDFVKHSPHNGVTPEQPEAAVKQDVTLEQAEVEVKQEITIEVDMNHPITKQEENENAIAFTNDAIVKEDAVKIKGELTNDKKKVTSVKKRNPKKKKIHRADNGTRQNKNLKQIHRQYESYVVQVKTNDTTTYSCKTCGGCYTNKKELFKHVSLQHRGRYKCDQCGKQFVMPQTLIRHKELHLDKNECRYCGKQFSTKSNLKIHENIHTEQVVYKCDICQKELKYKNSLRKHILETHSDQKELLCDFCGWSFKQKSNLEAHIRTVHLKQRPFPCLICDKTYTAKKHLKNHMKVAHSGNPKPYGCDVCPKSFACPKSLKIHRLTHDNLFTCRYCFRIFNNKNDCDVHTKTHSVETIIDSRYGCPICGKFLKTKFTLNRHIELHSGVKKFSCNICGVKFTQKAAKYRHQKIKHDPDIKLDKTKCNLCKKPYRNIDKHMRTHSVDAKKYNCDMCSKSYSENNALNRHKSQKHYGLSHDCELCGKKYINKRSLETHKLKVHKIKKEIESSNFDDVELPIVT